MQTHSLVATAGLAQRQAGVLHTVRVSHQSPCKLTAQVWSSQPVGTRAEVSLSSGTSIHANVHRSFYAGAVCSELLIPNRSNINLDGHRLHEASLFATLRPMFSGISLSPSRQLKIGTRGPRKPDPVTCPVQESLKGHLRHYKVRHPEVHGVDIIHSFSSNLSRFHRTPIN